MSELNEVVTRVKASLKQKDVGPLLVASDVVRLADNWSEYQCESGFRSCSAFLVDTLGKGYDVRFFRRRHDAVIRIGESVRRTMNHEAAQWLASAIRDDNQLRVAYDAVLRATRDENGGNPMSRDAVARLVRKALGQRPSARVARVHCLECARRQERIAELEVMLGERAKRSERR